MTADNSIRAVLIGGVAGAGKTTVGRILAAQLGWQFRDADSFHTAANIRKMRSGVPLNDSDRLPWLARIGEAIDEVVAGGGCLVMACSLLRRNYVDSLLAGRGYLRLAFLQVEPSRLRSRLLSRRGHFFPPELLENQLKTLELPAPERIFDGNRPPEEVSRDIRERYRLLPVHPKGLV